MPEPGAVANLNVAAETLTVADVAALAEGREPPGGAAWTRRAAGRLRALGARRTWSMRFLVTGVTGFLGWRTATLLAERGHDVARPRASRPRRPRARRRLAAERVDAGDPAARALIAGCDVVLHFAGVPDPARRPAGPRDARCARTRARPRTCSTAAWSTAPALIYPSTVRAALEPPPDAYGLSKRLGEEACRHHAARSAVARLTSVFGPGQVAWEGATGAIAAFARRALEGRAIVIPGDPQRVRDFVYVDDVVAALEAIAVQGRWGETLTLASGRPTPLLRAAELVREAAGADDRDRDARAASSRRARAAAIRRTATWRRLGLTVRPIEDAVGDLCRVAPPPSRCSRPLLRRRRSPTACPAATGAGSSCAWRRGTSPRRRRSTPRSRSAATPRTAAPR